MLEHYWSRGRLVLLLVLIIAGVAALFFTSHNQQFYKRPIARVERVQTTSTINTSSTNPKAVIVLISSSASLVKVLQSR